RVNVWSFGAGLYFLSGGTLNVSTLNIANNGTFIQLGGYLNAGTILTPVGGASRSAFFAGELAVPSITLADGGLIGGNFATLPNRSVFVTNATTFGAFSMLTLNGGTFSTGSISGTANIVFNSGTLQLTGSNAT